jgi:4-carboxymuconolactone decarboxylase
MPRLEPLQPPYEPSVAELLTKWMPPGAAVAPLALFRTLARSTALAERMRPLAAGLLRGSLPARQRELVILRACARCGAEYEWGVHVAAFAGAAGLSDEEVAATTRADGAAAFVQAEANLLHLVDALHDTGTIPAALYEALAAAHAPAQLLELIVLAGFYHLISFVANAAGVEHEPWAARFPVAAAVAEDGTR